MSGIGTLISVIGLIKTNSLYELDNENMVLGVTSGLVEALNDPYSRYLTPEEWKTQREKIKGEIGGIGIYMLQDEESLIRIISPIKDTPAERAGLQHNDILLSVNDESVMGMNTEDAATIVRGEPGTQLELSVFRESDEKEYTFTIIREIINVPSVSHEMIDEDLCIGYIRVSSFTTHTAEEIVAALNELLENDLQGVIFDLRNNGGGDTGSTYDIAGVLLDGKEIVSIADASGKKRSEYAPAGAINTAIVVLANRNTASAAEIFAGALQDNDRAIIIGEQTYGKGLIQTIYPVKGGGALRLTTNKYFTPNGIDINELGITPDHIVENPKDGSQDLQLERALEIMKKQIL